MGAKWGMFWLPMCPHFVERNVQFNHPHGQYSGEADALGIYLEEKKNKILTDIVFPAKSTFLAGCGVSDVALSFLSTDVPAPVSASMLPETGPSQKAGGEALISFMMKLSHQCPSSPAVPLWKHAGRRCPIAVRGGASVPFSKQLSIPASCPESPIFPPPQPPV